MSSTHSPFVIVGGGPAAAAAARVLAQAGRDVVLLTAEAHAPYDRTHLSKQVLAATRADPAPLWDCTHEWRDRVDLRTGCRVEHLDVARCHVVTADGTRVGYERLLLATGAVPRTLGLPGEIGPGVHHLRDLADARALAADLGRARRIAIIGGGLIGLEVAAAAVSRGVAVQVLEATPRILTRGVPEPIATAVAGWHSAAGVLVATGVLPAAIAHGPGGTPVGVRMVDGTTFPADAVVVGVGVVPRDELAAAAGLIVDDGIVVDTWCRTSTDGVWAAGDAVRMVMDDAAAQPAGRGVRLESFTDAQRQGEVAATSMLADATSAALDTNPYAQAAFSWSDQFGHTVSCIGLAPANADTLTVCVPGAVVVLAVSGSSPHAVFVAGTAAATGRLVAAARHVVTRRAAVDAAALRAAGDLSTLTKTFVSAVRGR